MNVLKPRTTVHLQHLQVFSFVFVYEIRALKMSIRNVSAGLTKSDSRLFTPVYFVIA